MKRYLMFLLMAAAVTASAYAQDDDDMYFVPSRKVQKSVSVSDYGNSSSRSVDEYNRRYDGYAGSWQTGGGQDVSDSLIAEYEITDSSAYDMDDADDYAYSRRILRFHSPRAGIIISSPYYWDLVYGYGVYDFIYDSYWYDPFFWDAGWRWGYSWSPWRSWYGPMWGWSHPYHWDSWGAVGWNHGFAGPGGGHRMAGNSMNRGTVPGNRYGSGLGSGVRTNALAGGSLQRSSGSLSRNLNTARTSSSRYTSQRNEAATRNTQTATSRNTQTVTRNNQTAVSRNTQTATSRNTQTTTRNTQSYTPTTTSRSVSSGGSFSSGSRGGGSFGGGGGRSGGGGASRR